jgi:PAS domain S-box-containing protein
MPDEEEKLLRSVALQNADRIQAARLRAHEELLRTREALRENQERLRAALSAAGTGTFRWNMRTNAIDWDGNLGGLFGLEAGPTTQSLETFFAAVHPDDRPAVMAGCEQSARDGSDFDLEFRVTWPDGSVHWIADKAKAFLDESGIPLYMTGACADVTSRRQAAEALRENEERLRVMFNQGAVGIALAGLDGHFLDMNQKFADILGYDVEELRRRTFTELTHTADLKDTETAVARLVAGTIPEYSLEKRYLRGDGSEVWSLTTVTLLRDAAGRPQRFLGVIEDITSRKRTEEALRRSEAEYRHVAGVLQDETRILELLNETGKALGSTLDLRALVQSVTDAATKLSGAEFGGFFYNTSSESGDAFLLYTLSGASHEAFAKFGRPRGTGLFGPTFRGESPIRSDDVLEDPRYGTMAPHQGMAEGHLPVRSYLTVPVRSRSGDVIGGLFFGHSRVGVFSERTERLIVGVAAQAGVAIDNASLYEAAQKASQERMMLLESERAARSAAERLSELKDEFLATLSHELRTPLNAILGWAQVLRSGPKDKADLAKGLETIERNARVQTQLIEDLLDMSRITSGKLRLDIQTLEPAVVVEAAIDTVRPGADAKGIRLEKVLDRAAGPVSGDPNRLQQVVWNLLSNAIKFTPRDGRVQVVLERVEGHVEITVADTGVGIRREFIPHLFERFRQADASTTRAYGGLGLGLSIVKNLVELHGGTVQVTSPGEGRGTTVTVDLPLAVLRRSAGTVERPYPKTSSSSPAPAHAAELAGLTVLVVDDQFDARELVKRVLEDCGAQVLTAATVQEALSLVEAEKPDVLVTDIGIPETDGFELLRHVRALGSHRGGRIPAIALTAFARSEDRTRALRAGFVVHVSKPVDPAELVATVASVVGRVGQSLIPDP